MVLKVDAPVKVFGDVHGQYQDLMRFFDLWGTPDENGDIESQDYLFLGDYVDRGVFGIEVCVLLFCVKLNHPKNVVLLRGNHESRNMTETFTFRKEVLLEYDVEIYDLFIEIFDALPLAAQISGKYLAMHGGISPDLDLLDELDLIDRF